MYYWYSNSFCTKLRVTDTYTQPNPFVHRFGPLTTATAPPPPLLHYSSSTSFPPIPVGKIYKKKEIKIKHVQEQHNNTEDLSFFHLHAFPLPPAL